RMARGWVVGPSQQRSERPASFFEDELHRPRLGRAGTAGKAVGRRPGAVSAGILATGCDPVLRKASMTVATFTSPHAVADGRRLPGGRPGGPVPNRPRQPSHFDELQAEGLEPGDVPMQLGQVTDVPDQDRVWRVRDLLEGF